MNEKSSTPFGIILDDDYRVPKRKYIIFAEDMDAARHRANYLLGDEVSVHDFTEVFTGEEMCMLAEDEDRGG